MPTSLTNKKSFIAIIIATGSTVAMGDIAHSQELYQIDSFQTQFEGEEFVGSYSNGIAHSMYTSNGLEVGLLILGDGYEAGDAHPGWTPRGQELQTQVGLADVLGGVRKGNLLATSELGSQVSVNSVGGGLSFNTSFGTQAKLDLTYDGGGQLNQDFSSIADGAFKISLINGDMYNPQYGSLRPVPISVLLTSGLGTDQEQSYEVGSTLLESGVDHLFNFDDFQGVNFADIDRISLKIDQSDEITKAVDFQLGAFSVVGTPAIPAPGAISLLAVSGLCGLRRRR